MAKDRRAGITPRSEDYSRWYLEVIQRAELADYAPVKGCMVIRPHGFAIWERIRDTLDTMIKETGHQNAYFPLLIPVSFLEKEADHVEGFAMECAVVTHSGLEKNEAGDGLTHKGPLEEPLILRPTSETIIWHAVRSWIQSWRDLPLLLNQWANVLRWEMRPRLFLRTLEFLWQEGHTAHADHDEAREETMRMLEVYRTLLEEHFAIHVVPGRKSESEKFPGAVDTFTIEAMMQDGKALQAGTSHDLGQNFSKAFDVTFQDRDGDLKHVWTTSWGVSTRLVGALIMAHSDDKGLVIPPRLAPTQCVVIPFMRKDKDREVVRPVLDRLAAGLREAGVRFHIDDRDHLSPGAKFYEWEGKGVPLRVEIGPRDVEKGSVMVAHRFDGEKAPVAFDAFIAGIQERLDTIQAAMLDRHRSFCDERTCEASSFEELGRIIGSSGGWVRAPWCGSADCEAQVKEQTKATIRCVPLGDAGPGADAVCIVCSGKAAERPIFAKAY
jgi:prolyl-tRNA synthetase